jgi:hypothetical protein
MPCGGNNNRALCRIGYEVGSDIGWKHADGDHRGDVPLALLLTRM